MKPWSTEIDATELDFRFTAASRFPLLSAEQEKIIDHNKWQASENMLAVILADSVCRSYLREVLTRVTLAPPAVAEFDSREQFFTLRRELSNYLDNQQKSRQLAAFCKRLGSGAGGQTLAEESAGLKLPASLVAGLAVVLLRSAGRDYSCPIADALAAWHTSWQQNPRSSVAATAPLPGSVQGLGHHLQLFRNARDALTLHNLRLVYQIAGRNRERGIPLLDLIQEGTLGLMRAAEKYDYSLGFRFSTYSYNWISQAVGRLISDQRALIRYPNHIQEQLSQLYRCREELQLSSGVAPTEPQLARLSGLPLERVRSLLALRNQPSSLDSPVYDDNTETQGDQLAGGPFSEPTATANAESLRRCMRHALTSLTSAEEQVISLRWGLDDTAPLSRGDIAELMSVSREWVRQLEGTALEKLRGSELVREAFQDYRHTP